MKFISIDELTLLENNPRKITEDQFKKLCKSLKEDPQFFELRPCLVNKRGDELIVYAGNQRVRAAKKLGWHQVPCMVDDNLSESRMKSRVAKDNKTYGNWDYDLLLSDFDEDVLIDAGFLEIELTGPEDIDLDLKKVTKDKKQKTCPSCGELLP